MNIDMNSDIKIEVEGDEFKEIIPLTKDILKDKIEKRILMSVNKDDHQAPLDLSDKSKIKEVPHGSREVLTKYHVPQQLYQTPITKVVNQRHLSTALVSTPINRVRGPVQRLSNLHITQSTPVHVVPSPPVHITSSQPVHITSSPPLHTTTSIPSLQIIPQGSLHIAPSTSLPREIVIPHVIASPQGITSPQMINSPQVITSSSFSTINLDKLDNVTRQQLIRTNSIQEELEDPSSPNSNSSQTHSYSEEELMKYPKGPMRRQRILQNSLSEDERIQRERFINNESSRRYRQRKHLAQKNIKEQEELLIAKQAQLKEEFVKLKQESELYYSYFKRTFF